MTRKRFVKLMMAKGWSRNAANKLAYLRRNDRMDGFLAVRKAVMIEVLLRLGFRQAAQSEVAHE